MEHIINFSDGKNLEYIRDYATKVNEIFNAINIYSRNNKITF